MKLYTRSGEKGLFELITEYNFFPDYIYSVVGFDDEKFIVGCKNGKIYICTYEDNSAPLVILEGKYFLITFLDFLNKSFQAFPS